MAERKRKRAAGAAITSSEADKIRIREVIEGVRNFLKKSVADKPILGRGGPTGEKGGIRVPKGFVVKKEGALSRKDLLGRDPKDVLRKLRGEKRKR